MNDNASVSSNSFSGFSAYSAGTSYTSHTVTESTVAQIFGSTKVKFHGRQKELDVLHGIYNEVCGGHSGRDNTNAKNESEPHIQIPDNIPDYHSTASASKSSVSTSTPSVIRKVALVSGISGAGKSALVRHFIKELRQTKNGIGHESGNENENNGVHAIEPLFLHGKFDELAGGADPFSAIVEAFTGLVPLLLEGRTVIDNEDDDDDMHNEFGKDLVRIQKDVRNSLRPDDM